jgi:hypothetical protein
MFSNSVTPVVNVINLSFFISDDIFQASLTFVDFFFKERGTVRCSTVIGYGPTDKYKS